MDDRQALRAYLQRGEVRLSTMHRIAGAFLSGAGLLLLIPAVLFNTLANTLNLQPSPSPAELFWLALVLFYGLPLWSLFLLIRDLVRFYFTANSPGVQDSHFYSRFVLSGINLSTDEGGAVSGTGSSAKDTVSASQTEKRWLDWVIPERSPDAFYYEEILEATSRHHLDDDGAVSNFVGDYRKQIFQHLPVEEKHRVSLLFVALRLAGSEDRSLLEETTKMELSLAKHGLALRHLVLRYMKALLLIVFTAVIAGIMSNTSYISALPDVSTRDAVLMLIWSIGCPLVVRFPIQWVSQGRQGSASVPLVQDGQLVLFERQVIGVAAVAGLLATCYLLIHLSAGEGLIIPSLLCLVTYFIWTGYRSFSRKIARGQISEFYNQFFRLEPKEVRRASTALLSYLAFAGIFVASALFFAPMLRQQIPEIGVVGAITFSLILPFAFARMVSPTLIGPLERLVTRMGRFTGS